MSLNIFLLGQFRLNANDLTVDLPSRPAQSLLAYLALNAGSTLRREKLASLLWAEATEANARGYLRQALWRIRKSLESASLQWDDYLQISEISITFDNQSDYWLDVDQLLKPAAGRPLEETIADVRLYRGELLPGFYDEWIGLERDRLQVAYYQKMDYLLEHLIQARRWDEALECGERWILQGYSAEPAYRALMMAYAGLGNPGMVNVTYQRCVEALSRDLDVEPSAQTIRLYEQIRRGELDEFEAPSAIRYEHASQLPLFFEKREPRISEYPLVVAREQELERLNGYLNLAISGRGRVIFITGEAGSGKTTLINEFTWRAQSEHADLIVASGNCNAHTGIGDPYLPFREILELLTGDVEARWSAGAMTEAYARFLWSLIPVTAQALVDSGPDLIGTFVSGSALFERGMIFSGGEGEWLSRLGKLVDRQKSFPIIQSQHQSDLFIQYSKVLQTLSRKAPVVLVLDDLQWADLGSISLLFHLGRHLAGSPILILGAYRLEDIALGRAGERHPLEPVVNELQREFGDIEVNVDQAECHLFIDAILDSEPNRLGRQFREMLCLLTRGQPLFTIELLRGMQERGDLVQDENGCWVEGSTLDWEALPARVEAVIAERIGRLDRRLQATLRTASVEGELFTAEVVARVQVRPEIEILERLSDEVDRKHHLIHAQSIQRIDGQLLSSFRFRHSLVQKYLYNSLDEVERVHLHEQVGITLEELYVNQMGTAMIAPQLARHFQEARNTEKAIHYLQLAGERALQVSAYQEAITHLERGLALLETLPEPHKYVQQELALQRAVSMAWYFNNKLPAPPMDKAFARAFELCQQVGNSTQLCQVLTEYAIFKYIKSEIQMARELAEKALAVGQQSEDWLLEASGHWCLGFVLYASGEYTQARHHLEQIASHYEPRQHHSSFLFLHGIDIGLSALSYLACCLLCLGYPEQALKRSQEALDMAREMGHSFTLADVLCYSGCEFYKIRQHAQLFKFFADALLSLTQEKSFPTWSATGKSYVGEALVMLGQPQEGIPLIRESISDSISMDVVCQMPKSLLSLAEAFASLDDPEQAIAITDQALELIRKTGERHWEAELYRLRSAIQLMQGDERGAETSLMKALEVSRQQNARWWELRAAIDLAHLWRKQGKAEQARLLVKEVYDWFTEGFDTPELREARELCS